MTRRKKDGRVLGISRVVSVAWLPALPLPALSRPHPRPRPRPTTARTLCRCSRVSTGQTTPTRPSRFTPHHQLPRSRVISRTYAQARKTRLLPCNGAIHDITDLGHIQFDDDNSIVHHR